MHVHYLWGGRLPSQLANAVHVMKMCEAIAGLGHAVTLYHASAGSGRWTRAEIDSIFAQYGIARPFALANLPARAGPLRHLLGLEAALRIRRAAAPDLVFSRFLPGGAWCAALGLPTVQELHVPPDSVSGRLYLRLLLHGRGFRKIVVITRALEREMRRLVPPARRADVLVEADGVNVAEYGAAAALPPPVDLAPFAGGRLLAGYIGSLHPGKGAELVLPIAARVPEVQFVVVGGPDDVAARYREQAAAAGVGNVAWLGHRPNADVPRYVRACDVLLLPNQRRVVLLGRQDIGQWTSPLKLFEYMAAAKVIMASDLPVLAEVLNAENAVLCDPEAPEQWAAELRRIAAGAVDYGERAARARRDVDRYAWPERARRCLEAATRGQPG